MIKEGEHLKGVEPINKKLIENSVVLNIIKNKFGIKNKTYNYLKELLNGRDVYDKSGYSGSSTIVVESDSQNLNSYVIKIQHKDSLKDEFISYNFFYKNNLASKPLKYFDCGEYELMIVEKIDLPVAGQFFNNYQEIAEYFGKKLREFHDLNLKNKKLSEEEKKLFENKYVKSFNAAVNSEDGLIYSSMYMNDYDYQEMKKFIKNNKNYLFDDIVLAHGDFNPNNVFEES